MTDASKWRLALARALADQYAVLPVVDAVFVGGSTARGQADRFSDIEMTVLWTQSPTEEQRAHVVAQFDGDLHLLYPYNEHEGLWEDLFFVGRDEHNTPKSGCQVEVSHYLLSTIEKDIDEVLLMLSVELELHNLMAGIRDGIPLHNVARITAWQEWLQQYPDALQLALIQHYGVIDHFWRWEMYIARGDNRMEAVALFTRILHQTLHLLLALNRRYFDGFKWLDSLLSQLTICPPHLSERIHRVYNLSTAEAAGELQSIVSDTFNLIEQHVPAANVTYFRQIFFYQRSEWEDAPPGLRL